MNDNNILIRWATANDADDLVALNSDFNGIGMSLNEVKDNIGSSNELIALAVIDKVTVGFACAQYFKSFCYRDLHGEVTEMFIIEGARRRGVATLLITFLEEELKVLGVSTVKVLTGIENDIAIQTYERSSYSRKKEVVLQKKL